jgi:hypothetical protein
VTDYGYVSVHDTKDAAQGEVLAELLRQEGIEARFRGPNSTLIGVAEHVVAMAVEVPADQEGRAREFLRDLQGTSVAAAAGAATEGQPLAAPSTHAPRGRGWSRGHTAVAVAIGLAVVAGLAVLALT